MDKIAIISDVHGNMPALEAVLADIQSRNIQTIFCLGDMVGKGPHSEIAVDRVRAVCEVVVTGNWDQLISEPQDKEEFIWHQHRLGEARLAYLKALPYSHDILMSGKRIRLFHASAESVYKRVQPWDAIEERMGMFSNTELTGYAGSDQTPEVVGYGDIHNAFLQHFSGLTLFNVGSVGNPLDIAQASYAVIEGKLHSKEIGPFSVQLLRVPYDIELAIKQAANEHMPLLEPYAVELRTARYRGSFKRK